MNDEANGILMQIGSMLLADPEYQMQDWESLSVVGVVIGTSVNVTGFTYNAQGKATPATPDNDDFFSVLENFQKATKIEGKPAWKSVLIQIKKPDLDIQVQFEYENALRWKVTPGNIEQMKITLKPT